MEHNWCIIRKIKSLIGNVKSIGLSYAKWKVLYLYLNLCSCMQQSFFILAVAGSCYGLDLTYCDLIWPYMHGYDAWLWPWNALKFNPKASIFFKIFSGGHSLSNAMLPMLICTIMITLNSLSGQICGWLAWPLKNCFLRPCCCIQWILHIYSKTLQIDMIACNDR